MNLRKYIKTILQKGFISGEELYHIKSTFGLPPEFIEAKFKVNWEGYEEAKKKHQKISRNNKFKQ